MKTTYTSLALGMFLALTNVSAVPLAEDPIPGEADNDGHSVLESYPHCDYVFNPFPNPTFECFCPIPGPDPIICTILN